MSAIEAARQSAARLHTELALHGFDPWSPYALVVEAARRRGIHVDMVKVGAAALDGGVGIWDPSVPLILHAKMESAFHDAFIVAHELGHAISGGTTGRIVTPSVDLSRASDEPEVGVDRVGDYSRRERKEVTMDLFARELVLPRAWVRHLHLQLGLGAAEISDRLGAPYEAVAQQMLDALLLPLPPDLEKPDGRPSPGLDDSQRVAATHTGTPFLLEAGPGTGKTRTLIARIEHLLAQGVAPEAILVLTYSNKAAGELVERISRSDPKAATAMWIGTFHSFGLDLVRRFHGRLGFTSEPTLIDRSEAVEMMEREFPRLPLEVFRDIYDPVGNIMHLLDAVSRAKDEVVCPRRYGELADAMAGSEPDAAKQGAEVSLFYASYEEMKHARNAVDFGDLVMLPVRLVEEDAGALAELRARHVHILVDEYQDVNHASVRLLRALGGDGCNLWVVGDARQSIYRFRGASSANMASFSSTFPTAKTGSLATNYRSTNEIVNLSGGFAATMNAGVVLSPEAVDGRHGLKPELRVCQDGDDELEALAKGISEAHASGTSWSSQAVLCMGNARLENVAARLEANGIPALFLGVIFERPEIRDLLSLLSLAGDRYGAAVVRLAAHPDFRMGLSEAMTLVSHLRGITESQTRWAGHGIVRDGMSEDAVTALDRLDEIFVNVDHRTHPWRLCLEILLDRTSIARRVALGATVADQTRGIAIWQFMNYVRIFPHDERSPLIHRFLERVRRLVRLLDDRDLRRPPEAARHIDAVRLMTIHGSKGLEFEVVHLPGLHARGMPGQVRKPRILPPDGMIAGLQGQTAKQAIESGGEEEKKCLFYVAASRARQRFIMYRRTSDGGKNANASKFLYGLEGKFDEVKVPSSNRSLVPPEELPVIHFTGDMVVSAYKLALYDRCPQRFLYTHVLRLGGRRRDTPYMRLHDAIRDLVERCCRRGVGEVLSRDAFLHMFEDAWNESGAGEDGYSDDYLAIARKLAEHLWEHVSPAPAAARPVLEIAVPNGRVVARIDEASFDAEGVLQLKRIETGRARKDDADNLEYQVIGAASSGIAKASPNLVHLTDGTVGAIPLAKSIQELQLALAGRLASIKDGQFRRKPSAEMCPRCPSYFICGMMGSGDYVSGPIQ
jgi:superfamily I DNA/RNA helicase